MRRKVTWSVKGIAMMGAIVTLGALLWMFSPMSQPTTNPAHVALTPDDKDVVRIGQSVYAAQCASCHGANLKGQQNWRSRLPNGMLPAPPHDATGHTWHHNDAYLFGITKYGVETLIGKPYANAMPAYEDIIPDADIIAALSYIKSTWPKTIQQRHDQLNQQWIKQQSAR